MRSDFVFINKENLLQGITVFQSHNWPRDFHSSLYQDLNEQLRDGVNTNFWSYVLPILSGWRAIRPRSHQFIAQRGLELLKEVDEARVTILKTNNETPLSIEFSEWTQVKFLFELALSIKEVDSPVFASKLCHFLLPGVYPVADRAVININKSTYKGYWEQCKEGWINCTNKEDLIKLLQNNMKSKTAIYKHYPWATKISELCYMARVSKP